MTELTQENASYNQRAIATAHKLADANATYATPTKSKKPDRNSLFPQHNLSGLGVALEYEAMGNRPVSDQLAAQAEQLGVEFEHIGLTLGTVLHNVDLKQLSNPALIALVRATLLERKVIFFRDQHLSEDQQVAFAREFGELDAFPFGATGENPFILEIHHNEHSPGRENSWHTDVTWMEKPSLGSVAQCIVVPPYGGDTLFADSAAAYHGLREELKEQLQHLAAINDYRVFISGRGAKAWPASLVEEIKQDIPFGVSHPLLRTHPETGKTGLYIHGGFLRHDSLYDTRTNTPLGADASKSIVQELLDQHSKAEYICRFKWTPGSIAFWDNRAVQHYAASDYYPHERLLRRVTISGDKPYYQPSSTAST
jgi:alpha-ketoglutarate-dependent taurine dioxygenase